MLLYIHIPFCDSKCSYCAFNSYVDKHYLKKEYMHSLYIQLEHELKRFKAEHKSVETLFIGGGTPSTVEPGLYKPLFELIRPYLKYDAEITSEANPNSATREWLLGMYELGVNRLSFGVQSFDERKLKTLNRAHKAQDAKNAVLNAHKIGFKNISIDLIYATMGDTRELLHNDIETAFSLPINHISAYSLTIEEGTAFASRPQMSKESLKTTHLLFEKIKEKGFKHYEISNFGTHQSKHNLGYWHYKDYMGAGSGAVGKLNDKRFYPNTNIQEYIKDPLDIRVEELSKEDMKIERIFLGLRSCIGVDEKILNEDEIKKASLLVNEKKLKYENDFYYNEDYLLADEIALFLST